jgi:F-type H+-transporting ATPase subunit epsilon
VQRIAVHSGFVEVSDNHVALLCDVAELAEDIDVDRAKMSLENAKSNLATNPSSLEDEAAIHRAEVRLEAVSGL